MFNDKSFRSKNIDIVALVDEDNLDSHQFLLRGAIAYSDAVGRADVISMRSFDPDPIVNRMKSRRSMYIMDRRGRPKKSAA